MSLKNERTIKHPTLHFRGQSNKKFHPPSTGNLAETTFGMRRARWSNGAARARSNYDRPFKNLSLG